MLINNVPQWNLLTWIGSVGCCCCWWYPPSLPNWPGKEAYWPGSEVNCCCPGAPGWSWPELLFWPDRGKWRDAGPCSWVKCPSAWKDVNEIHNRNSILFHSPDWWNQFWGLAPGPGRWGIFEVWSPSLGKETVLRSQAKLLDEALCSRHYFAAQHFII